jgi:hypothetical protein
MDQIIIRRLMARQRQASQGETQMLSLMHPRFNLREIAKHMILLEDHLSHPRKHCPDCIRKHLMTIEGFAEEAASLDTVGVYRPISLAIAEAARRWMTAFIEGTPDPELGQQIRKVRKKLVPMVADPRAKQATVRGEPCPH